MTNGRLYNTVVDDINLTYTGPRGSTAHLHHKDIENGNYLAYTTHGLLWIYLFRARHNAI